MKYKIVALALLLSACSMEPKYVQPASPVPPSWPVGDAYLRQSEAALPSLTYRQILADNRLQSIIAHALENNRDLRIAAANIVAARAQVRIREGNRLPEVTSSAGVSRGDNGSGASTSLTADVGVNAFEIDLFGRLASLSRADQATLLATEAGARATKLAMVSDIADAWLSLAANRSLLKIAQDTANNAKKNVDLTEARRAGGIAPRSDVRQAEQILETAKADIASLQTEIAQDQNLLQLLVGAPVDVALLPNSIAEAGPKIQTLPAGLDSRVLLRRPDVVQAEYQLRSANAEIGAARAALFPTISLTGIVGLASNALSSLFTGGAFTWNAGVGADYSIFSGGADRANVAQTEAQRDAALATYEKTIQTAFREVSDALARQGTIGDERAANMRNEEAAADNYMLANARYRGGIDTFLESLDAQRSLYAAQQQVITIQLTEAQNKIDLYRTIGSDPEL